MSPEASNDVRLLAVDLGLRCGWAAFGGSGRLVAYGSRHFGSRSALRTAVPDILGRYPRLALLVVEGDVGLAVPWKKEASRRGVVFQQVAVETWRRGILPPRERRTGKEAKAAADRRARDVIERSGARRPTSLRHDAAEAILIGAWAAKGGGPGF